MSGGILRAIDYYRKRDDSSVRRHTYQTTMLDSCLAHALDRHAEKVCIGENIPCPHFTLRRLSHRRRHTRMLK